jgi:hypothetical protein
VAGLGADLIYLLGGLPSRLRRFTPRAGGLLLAPPPLSASRAGIASWPFANHLVHCQLARCAIARARFNMRLQLGGGDIVALPAISPASVHCGARQGALQMAYRGTTARWPGSSHRIRPAGARRDVTAQINYSAQLS